MYSRKTGKKQKLSRKRARRREKGQAEDKIKVTESRLEREWLRISVQKKDTGRKQKGE